MLKNILIIMSIISSLLKADNLDDRIKTECINQISNLKSDPVAYAYLKGSVQGIITTKGTMKMNFWAKNATLDEMIKKSCQKTLKSKFKNDFYSHYRFIAFSVLYLKMEK